MISMLIHLGLMSYTLASSIPSCRLSNEFQTCENRMTRFKLTTCDPLTQTLDSQNYGICICYYSVGMSSCLSTSCPPHPQLFAYNTAVDNHCFAYGLNPASLPPRDWTRGSETQQSFPYEGRNPAPPDFPPVLDSPYSSASSESTILLTPTTLSTSMAAPTTTVGTSSSSSTSLSTSSTTSSSSASTYSLTTSPTPTSMVHTSTSSGLPPPPPITTSSSSSSYTMSISSSYSQISPTPSYTRNGYSSINSASNSKSNRTSWFADSKSDKTSMDVKILTLLSGILLLTFS